VVLLLSRWLLLFTGLSIASITFSAKTPVVALYLISSLIPHIDVVAFVASMPPPSILLPAVLRALLPPPAVLVRAFESAMFRSFGPGNIVPSSWLVTANVSTVVATTPIMRFSMVMRLAGYPLTTHVMLLPHIALVTMCASIPDLIHVLSLSPVCNLITPPPLHWFSAAKRRKLSILTSVPFTLVPFRMISITGNSFATIPLAAISLAAISFAAISVATISFATITLTVFPLTTISLAAIPLAAIPLTAIPLTAIPLTAIPFTAFALVPLALTAIALTAITLTTITLAAIALTAISLAAIELTAISLEAIPVVIPLAAITFTAIPFTALPLAAILGGTRRMRATTGSLYIWVIITVNSFTSSTMISRSPVIFSASTSSGITGPFSMW